LAKPNQRLLFLKLVTTVDLQQEKIFNENSGRISARHSRSSLTLWSW
jgi:hypothetical protein